MDIDCSYNEECFKCDFLVVSWFFCTLGKPSCDYGEFQCNNGKCINFWKICDWRDDCGDNTDESKTNGAFCGMLKNVFAVIK